MHRSSAFLAAVLFALCLPVVLAQQKLSNFERDRSILMLHNLADDVKKYYYDHAYQGTDFDARVKAAEEKIRSASSLGQTFGNIAWALQGLHDSHTFFLPPGRSYVHDYGFRMQMIGDRCFLIAVRPRTDAEAKGLHAGDEVITFDGFPVNLDSFQQIKYVFNVLRPQPIVQLVLRSPQGAERTVDVIARRRERKLQYTYLDIWALVRMSENDERLSRSRVFQSGDGLMIWKLPVFDLDENHVHDAIKMARNQKAVILDLRGNPGGLEQTLAWVLGGFFDYDVKVADRTGRKNLKPVVAKTMGKNCFGGKLIVLVDRDSASASELFARVVQLEKRGTILGDHTAGAVMESRFYPHVTGTEELVPYGAAVTEANLIMADGKSLEKLGVVPDQGILATAADLAAQRDPVLARAAQLAGFDLTPEAAGKLFPTEWLAD